MTTRKKKGRIGSSFSEYMKGEGRHEEASAVAIKRVLAWELEKAMQSEGVTKNEIAPHAYKPQPAWPHPRSRQRQGSARYRLQGGTRAWA
jgi:hypothetical protein